MHSHLPRRLRPLRVLALTATLLSSATLTITGAAQASASGAPAPQPMKHIPSLTTAVALDPASMLRGTAAATAAAPATATLTAHGGPAASTPTAQPAPPSCPSQYVCGYTGPNYTGSIGVLISDNPDLTGPGSIWENVDSIYNNGAQCEVWMYRAKNYAEDGHVVGFKMQTGFKNLQTQAPGLYHHTWSNHWCTNT